MDKENILLLESFGYKYNDNGYIVDTDGNYLESVDINGKVMNSPLDRNSYLESEKKDKKLQEIGFSYKENEPGTMYDQKEDVLAKLSFDEYFKAPEKNDVKDTPYIQKAFGAKKANGEIQEDTLEAYKNNNDLFSTDPVIKELSQSAPENIPLLKDVRRRKEEIMNLDSDVDTILDTVINEEEKPDANFMDKANDWIWDKMYGGLKALTPTGAGMKDEKLREEYKELIAKEKELTNPSSAQRIALEEVALDAMKLEKEEYLKKNSEDFIDDVIAEPAKRLFGGGALGDKGDVMDHMIRNKEQRILALKDYMTHDEQNWFMKNLANPVIDAGKSILKDISFATVAHDYKNVYAAIEKVNADTATEYDKQIVNDYVDGLEHDEYMAGLPSLGAVHDTAEGLAHSLGFMAEMRLGGGFAEKGGKKILAKAGGKYLDETVIMAINKLGRNVPKTYKPFVKGVLNNTRKISKGVGEGALVPLGMGSTYSGVFDKKMNIIKDDEGNILMDDAAYQYEINNLNLSYKASEDIITELSAKPRLTEEEKADLMQAMSVVGKPGEIHGISRNKAIPTYKELAKDLKPVGWGESFYQNYTTQLAEVLSEKTGEMGIGSKLAGTKYGKKVLDNKVGRYLTTANEGVKKMSGGYVHSVFDEAIEENLVPVYNYAFNGKESELHSMMSLDAQKDVAIQTVAMNMLFKIPGMVTDNLTAEGRAQKKWLKSQREENKTQKDRLSSLYKNIASIGTEQDLSEIIDLTSLPGQSNQQTVQNIALLKAAGKDKEAAKLQESLFDFNLLQAIKTNTVGDFETALDAASMNQNTNAVARTAIIKAKESIVAYKAYEEAHGHKQGGSQIVQNLLNRDLNKKALLATKEVVREGIEKNKDEYENFDRNFKRVYDNFMADGTKEESMDSGGNYLSKRFKDKETQDAYNALLKNNAKELSPELQSVVNTAIVGEGALRNSIKVQDKLHIELTSVKNQKALQSKNLIEKNLYREFTKNNNALTDAQIEKVFNGTDSAVLSNLSPQEIAETKKGFKDFMGQIAMQTKMQDEFKAKARAQQAVSEIVPDISATPKPKRLTEGSVETTPEDTFLAKVTNQMKEDESNAPEFSSRRVTPEAQTAIDKIKFKIGLIAKRLDAKLGRPATLQDFIEDNVGKYSYEDIESKFNGYVAAWKTIGKDVSKAQEVYDSIFGDEDLLNELLGTVLGEEDAIAQTGQIQKQTIIETAKKEDFTENGKVVSTDIDETDKKTTDPTPKAAHNHLDYITIGDREFVVASTELVIDPAINNNFILLPDFIKEGDELIIRESEDDDTPITSVTTKGRQKTTWGAFKADNKIERGSKLHTNKVPMIAYKVVDGVEVPAFYIHDVSWYNESNISNRKGSMAQQQAIEEGIANVTRIREAVIAGNNKITINRKTFGSISRTADTKSREAKTINEATGSSQILIYRDGQLFSSMEKGTTPVKIEVINNFGKTGPDGKFTTSNGQIFDVRQIGINQKTGQPTYQAYPVITPSPTQVKSVAPSDVNRTAFNNIKFAILANTILNNQSNAALLNSITKEFGIGLGQATQIQEAIRRTTGVNIATSLEGYVSLFTNTYNGSDNVQLKDISSSTDTAKYPTGKTYVKGFRAGTNSPTGNVNIFNKNAVKESTGHMSFGGVVTNVEAHMRNLSATLDEQNGVLNKIQMHVNAKLLGDFTHKNTTMVTFGPKGQVVETDGNYENYLKNNLKTNVLSYKVTDTKGETQWITDVQPMIYYDLSEESVATQPTSKEVKEPVTFEEAIKQASQETIQEIDEVASQDILEKLSPELGLMYLNALQENQENTEEEFDSRRNLTVEEQADVATLETRQISSLSKGEQNQIITSLVHSIISSIDFSKKDLNLKEISDKIENSLETFLQPQIDGYKEILKNISSIPSLAGQATIFQAKIDKLETIFKEKGKLFSRERGNKGLLIENFENLFSTSLEEEEINDENTQDENFSTSFLEKDMKLSFSTAMKLSLFGYEKLNKSKQKLTNFANMPEFQNADDIYLKLLEVTTDLDSDWNLLLDRLEYFYKTKKDNVYIQLRNKLQNLPEHIQNEILYKSITSKLNMYTVLYSYDDKTKKYTSTVIDNNSSKDNIKLPLEFKSNYENSAFGMTKNKERVLNKEYATEFLTKLQADIAKYSRTDFKPTNENLKLVRSYFLELGISVNNNTIKEYVSGLNENNKTPFDNSEILGLTNNSLRTAKNEKTEVVLKSKSGDLYKHISGVVKNIVNIEVNLNGSHIAKSMRTGDKTVQGVIAKTMIYDMVRDIIPTEVNGKLETTDFYNTVTNAPLSKDNFLLKFLKDSEIFRDLFSVDFVSLEASKQQGQKVFSDRGVDQIPAVDAMITEMGFATSRRENVVLPTIEALPGLKFRVGQMYFPALADKGRMTMLRTALLDVTSDEVTFNADGSLKFDNEAVVDLLTENLFTSELSRILMSYNNADTKVKGFDKAAKLFLMIPALNNLEYIDKNGEKINIHKFLTAVDERTGQPNYKLGKDAILSAFKNPAKEIVKSIVQNEVNKKVSLDGKEGVWVEADFYNPNIVLTDGQKLKHLDTDYLSERKAANDLETIKTAAADFVINNLLNQSNVYQLFLGDMAYFSKDQWIANEDITETDYVKLAKQISTVIDKRAAMLIAPGNKLANSDVSNQKEYLQIQINDVKSMSSGIAELIEAQYGALTSEERDLIDRLNQNKLEIQEAYASGNYNLLDNSFEGLGLKDIRKSLISKLKSSNSALEAYFDIEGTDAQEYTTWKTHVDMLFRQGRLTPESKAMLTSAYGKMSSGNFDGLTEEELKVVMQPVKPVYTGSIPVYNKQGEIISNRPIYIKSSSYPLIPQLTKNLKLDKMRQHMEKLENQSGKMVRMSYQTANKIGAIDTKLTTDDLYNKSFEELYSLDATGNTIGLLAESSTVLKTKNFKIQQETPYKIDKFLKKGQDNYIRMGSQFWKVILGNEINLDDTRAIFPNKFSSDLLKAVGVETKNGMLTGMDLDKIDFFVYKEYSQIQKDALYTDLGLDLEIPFTELSQEDKNNVIKNITKILKEEIVSRDYPEYLKSVIELVEDASGNLETEMPIFLDNSSYKFESLLQAVISVKMIEHKLPGSAHISGSSEGFERVASPSELSVTDRQGIVWLDPNHSGELKATRLSNGKLIESEVLIQSHYRQAIRDEEGKIIKHELIDLSSDAYSENILDADGKVIGRKLLLDRIDPELISQFSFRIPTSSHQSGVILKVVGFLPPQTGDLLVVPKEHTVQLGEDYDVDKRNVYKSNYTVNEDGSISQIAYAPVQSTNEKYNELFKEYKNSKREIKDDIFSKITEVWHGNKERLLQLTFAKHELDILLRDPTVTNLEEVSILEAEIASLNSVILSSQDVKKGQDKLRQVDLNGMLDLLSEAFENEKAAGFGKFISYKQAQKSKMKMLENAMIDIYKSIYQTTDADVQKNIFKVLSVAAAKNTANWMDDKLNSENVDLLFTPLSDIYQKDLMKLGADGKGGIGVHSNAVTLEAQFQRLPKDGKVKIYKAIYIKVGDETVKELVPSIERIGDLVSDGVLGNPETIDRERTISDVHTENQNSSTDNINEQIMGKRNENSYTMSVFALMAHRGFDMSTSEVLLHNGKREKVQMTSLFMNQPILRDYVALKQKYDSMTEGFIGNSDDKILGELIAKYSTDDTQITEKLKKTKILKAKSYNRFSEQMRPQTLWDNLSANAADGMMQLAILEKFFRFKAEADAIREYQQLINLSTSKLGLSFFEVIQRIDMLDNLAEEENLINMARLVGDFELPSELEEENIALKEDGYTLLGQYFWKPTTKEGVMLINSLKAGQDIMGINFPYQEKFIAASISNIFWNKDVDPSKKSATNLKWKYEIMSAYKDFVNSSSEIGVFDNDTNKERSRLFFDEDGNESLATFINNLKISKHPVITNALLAVLQPKINKTGAPSLLLHITETNTNLDKSDKYEAFKDLLLDNTTDLGIWNGEKMTPQKLAQDLASYSHLANNENGAIGFRDFINLDYFKKLDITRNFRKELGKLKTDARYEEQFRNRFVRQYLQHNPNRAPIMSASNTEIGEVMFPTTADPKILALVETIKIANTEGNYEDARKLMGRLLKQMDMFATDELLKPKYKAVRNSGIKLSNNKFNLFELKEDGFYHRIPTLGTFGYNEYNREAILQSSLIDTESNGKSTSVGNSYILLDGKQMPAAKTSDLLDLSNGVQSLLQQFHDSTKTSPEYKQFIEELQSYIKPDTKIVYSRPQSGALGSFNPNDNTIYLHPEMYKKALELTKHDSPKAIEMMKEIVLEEIIHSITAKEISKYIESEDKNGNIVLKENAPLFATKLKVLYDIARSAVPYDPANESTYYSKNIQEFIAGVFVAPDYRALLESKDKGFIQKFKEMLKSLLGFIYQENTGKTLTYTDETFKAIFELLKDERIESQGITIVKNPMKEIMNNDTIEVGTPEIGRPTIVESLQERMTKLLPTIANPTALAHVPKELEKTRIATQYIGEGSSGSSTDRYKKMYEKENVANTGIYSPSDIIYVSSNGKRGGRVNPVQDGVLQGVYTNVQKAMNVGATIVMDTKAHLDKTAQYNIGEIALADYVSKNGYERQGETGIWKPITKTMTADELEEQRLIALFGSGSLGGAQGYDSRRGGMDLGLEDKYFKEGRIQRNKEVVSRIANSNHPLSKVAKKLEAYIPEGDMMKLISFSEYSELALKHGSFAGLYNPNIDQIYINEGAGFRGLGGEPTILHEVLHSLTLKEMSKDKEKYEQIEKFWIAAKKSGIKAGDGYALKDPDEFIVGLFTDAALIRDLKDVPAIESKKYDNLFEEIFDYILSLFKVTKKEETLYSQAFALASHIIESNYLRTEAMRQPMEERLPEIKKCK